MSKSKSVEIVVKGSAVALLAAAGAAKAQDFDGLYGGLSYNKGSGEVKDGVDVYNFEGNATGLFVGYNHVAGDWLFGGELSMSNGNFDTTYPFGGNYLRASDLREVKARAGYIMGRTLVYGVLGRSSMDMLPIAGSGLPNGSTGKATAYGVGVETRIGDKAFVGAEYLTRDLDLTGTAASYASDGAELNTLSIRVGLQF